MNKIETFRIRSEKCLDQTTFTETNINSRAATLLGHIANRTDSYRTHIFLEI